MRDDQRPIIVGGCYRSGTSLVRRLLDSHPRIHCGPEVKLFRDFYGDYLGIDDSVERLRFLTTARSLLPEPELLEVLGMALVEMHERAARAAGKPRWADKVPENVVFLDEWQRILGDHWVFLHVVRNPLDTLASIDEVGFPRSIPSGLDERIDLYVEYLEAGLRFATAHPERYVRVFYDDLVRKPEETCQEMMEDLGESFHAEQLAINASAHQSGVEDWKAARASGIYLTGVGRWRQAFSQAQADKIVDGTAASWARLDCPPALSGQPLGSLPGDDV